MVPISGFFIKKWAARRAAHCRVRMDQSARAAVMIAME